MKLRNKVTGEIKDFALVVANSSVDDITLAELNEEWKDYEEPKEYYYYIDDLGVVSIDRMQSSTIVMHKNFGNYFETREEAEETVEILKAWKRLKDKGFRFNGGDDACISYRFDPVKWDDELENDFDLLFGGEE